KTFAASVQSARTAATPPADRLESSTSGSTSKTFLDGDDQVNVADMLVRTFETQPMREIAASSTAAQRTIEPITPPSARGTRQIWIAAGDLRNGTGNFPLSQDYRDL